MMGMFVTRINKVSMNLLKHQSLELIYTIQTCKHTNITIVRPLSSVLDASIRVFDPLPVEREVVN